MHPKFNPAYSSEVRIFFFFFLVKNVYIKTSNLKLKIDLYW